MKFWIDKKKEAVRNSDIFKGLAVPKRSYHQFIFLQETHYCVVIEQDNKQGYVIFSVLEDVLQIHLINCLDITGNDLTGQILKGFLLPYCKENSLKKIQTDVVNKSMAEKLKRLGFVWDEQTDLYEMEVL